MIDIGAGKKYIKKFLAENIEYESLDFEGDHDFLFNLDKGKFPIKENTYDIVMCLETLEHTIYPPKIMEELLRIAKPNAIFLLSMPNEYNFYCRINFLLARKTEVQETFMTSEKNLHIHSPRQQDILNFFSKYIKILEVDYQWYSRTSYHNKSFVGAFFKYLDNFLGILAPLLPLFFQGQLLLKE